MGIIHPPVSVARARFLTTTTTTTCAVAFFGFFKLVKIYNSHIPLKLPLRVQHPLQTEQLKLTPAISHSNLLQFRVLKRSDLKHLVGAQECGLTLANRSVCNPENLAEF